LRRVLSLASEFISPGANKVSKSASILEAIIEVILVE
jgi:hypothetical protein